jgi:hypothetical protein
VDGRLTAGDLTGRVIGLAIKVHKTVALDFWSGFMRIACAMK